jgi:alanine dehydrogenase
MEGDRRAREALPMTLLLGRADVERLLPAGACIEAVEDAFRQLALGNVPAPGILGMHAAQGSFHVKAGFLGAYFAAKVNANFPGNTRLPTIQGAVILFDATNGRPLAIMDSISITAIRTAAATAVAAKYLAREECDALLVCGCGGQAASQLEALLRVRTPRRILSYDRDRGRAVAFAARFGGAMVEDLTEAVRSSDIVVTCTTANRYFITREMIRPGTFIAAVGADSERKQEIDPQLLAEAKVVTDLTEQAARIGDLHHAIEAGVMSATDVHAELGEVIAGSKSGRERPDEVIVFDSTGTGLQDVAAAAAVYETSQEIAMKGALPTFALAGATALSAHAQAEGFDTAKPGSLPPGWECGVTGKGSPRWAVEPDSTAPSAPHVLQQSGSGTFPWCVKRDASIVDGAVEVKFKPMRGRQDQAGGVVWRWKDGDNYYVARANALENNVSLYYTEKGRRNTLKYVDAPVPANAWHTLRVEFSGTRIRVALNGKVYIELDDAHIKGAGAVGLWTKADSVTAFDDFSYAAK